MQRLCLRFLAALLLVSPASADDHAAASKPSLDDLIAKIPQVAAGGGGVSPAEVELAKQLQSFGPTSVPRLVALLDSPDEHVREFAGYLVRGLDGLTESDLDALIKARLRGDGWIPPAIAAVGTPRAIAFLVDELQRKPEHQSQLTWALSQAGEKAAPALAAVFRQQTLVSRELSDSIAEVFGDMGAKAGIAVPQLLETSADRTLPKPNRLGAVRSLGSIGLAAADAVPKLQRLAKSEPEVFADAVNRAILGIGTPDAAEILMARLQSVSPGFEVTIILRDIAALRENGRKAGPEVLKVLHRDQWENRVNAALTLGYIGYSAAAADLKRVLSSQEDWRLVYAATVSLGRLKDQTALPNLRQLAKAHWSPVVRKAALKAFNVIQGTEVFESRWHPSNFAFEYFEYQNLGYEASPEQRRATEKFRFRTDSDELPPAKLSNITYSIEIVGYDEKGRQVEQRNATPGCAFRFGNGLLLGGDRGEWGGELVYQDEKGATSVLLEQNIHAIHRMPFGVVATVGLAHLTMNSGYLYLVTRGPDGKPNARPWNVLPGAPMKSGVLENGDLFVSCYGGDVLITPTGEFRRVE
jgi:HEAT repeat protein